MPPKTRTRSTSVSSTTSVDLDRVHWRQERSVVKTLNKDVDQEDWPTFELLDVTIYEKDGKTMRSALDASMTNQLIVRGYIVIDDRRQRLHLLQRIRQSAPIEIPSCKVYSVGESQSGEAIIWVGGEGAWYEVKPSSPYIGIYDKMCEATKLYYQLSDWHVSNVPYAKKKTAPAKVDLKEVFLDYAKSIGDGSTYKDVCSRCTEHGNFLLHRLDQDDSNGSFPWKKSSLYEWLVGQQAAFGSTRMEELPVRTLSVPSQSPPTGRRKKLSGSLATTTVEPSAEPSNTASSSRKIPVSKEDSSRPILHIKPLADPYNDPPLQKLLDALETSFDDMANDKTPMTVTKLLNRFWFTYKFPYYKPKEKGPKQSGKHRRPIEEVFHRNAKDLLQLIHKDKYGVIYEWLEELAQQPLRLEALHPDQFPYIIVPRETSNRRASQMQLETNETSSRASSPRTPRTPPRVGKSLKQPGRSVKSVLRPITSTKKRSRQDSDVGATTDASPSRKSQHVAVDNNSSSSDDNDASMDMDVDMDLSNSEDPSDINLESNDTHDPIMKLFEERISTVIPRGNTRPWVCTESDCGFSVRSGDDMIDRAKIKDHMDGHRRSSRMDIIMAEQRSHLPIGNLLEKVQALGRDEMQNNTKVVSGQVVPNPIKKKLLV